MSRDKKITLSNNQKAEEFFYSLYTKIFFLVLSFNNFWVDLTQVREQNWKKKIAQIDHQYYLETGQKLKNSLKGAKITKLPTNSGILSSPILFWFGWKTTIGGRFKLNSWIVFCYTSNSIYNLFQKPIFLAKKM